MNVIVSTHLNCPILWRLFPLDVLLTLTQASTDQSNKQLKTVSRNCFENVKTDPGNSY